MKYNLIAIFIIAISFLGIVGVGWAGNEEDAQVQVELNKAQQGAVDSFQPLGNPLEGDINDPDTSAKPSYLITLYGKVINRFIVILGGVVMLIIAWNGLVWLTSGGQEEKVKSAKMAIVYAVGGLIIIFAAYAIVNFVLQSTIEASGLGPSV